MNATAHQGDMTASTHKTRVQSLVGQRPVLEKTVLMGGRARQAPVGTPAVTPPEPASTKEQLAFSFTRASRRALRSPTAPRLGMPAVERDAGELGLERRLLALLPAGRGLTIKLTDNRYTMVMVRRGTAEYTVRLHR